MEQQSLPIKNGRLTCRVRGSRAQLCMEVRPHRPGLYRGVLLGPKGRWDLGLLMPEGGCLRVCRDLEIDALERSGCWPVRGGDVVLAHAFDHGTRETLPPGWTRPQSVKARFPDDPVLAGSAEQTSGWLVRVEEDGTFSLAAPWDPGRPFPLVPAFCLAEIQTRAGRRWAVYRFRSDGTPVLPDEER